MRKIIVSMNVTLDGFIAGPDCELDWHFPYWNNEMEEVACNYLNNADTILFGRITYQGMSEYWRTVKSNYSHRGKDIVFAEMINDYLKIVISTTLRNAEWNNSRIVNKNIRREILKLKELPGMNMIVYGSGRLVSSLIGWDLIDEFVFWVHPVILKEGKQLNSSRHGLYSLQLISAKKLGSGVVVLHYVHH